MLKTRVFSWSNYTGKKCILFDAISILELGLEKSKFNYSFKLLLIRLYYELGVYLRPLELAEQLDVKQIQHDSVSYIYTEDMECFGQFSLSIQLLKESMIIYQRNEIETSDSLIQAFKFATFSKIPEFVDFRDRVRHSIQRIISTRQIIRAKLFGNFSKFDEFLDFIENIDQACLEPIGYLDLTGRL